MLLLHLLCPCVVSLLLSQLLVFLILLILQILALFILLRLQLCLLLLVFLVRFCVPGVWRSRAFRGRQVLGMDSRIGTSSSRVFWMRSGGVLWTRGRFMDRSALFGSNHSTTLQFSRLSSSGDRRLAVVCGSAQFRVRACGLDVFGLRRHRSDMTFMCGRFFLCSGTSVDASIATIEADAGDGGFVDARVVDVVNHIHVYVQHSAVIEKVTVIPASTFKTMAKVTEAVVNPAIETYLRAPVAIIENVATVSPAPIAWSPEKTDFGSHYPGSRHPKITVITVSPISGGPQIAVAGADWLLVDRQFRGSNRY